MYGQENNMIPKMISIISFINISMEKYNIFNIRKDMINITDRSVQINFNFYYVQKRKIRPMTQIKLSCFDHCQIYIVRKKPILFTELI